jgi:hypothetical protein
LDKAWTLNHQNVVDRLQRGQDSRLLRWFRARYLIDSLRTRTASKSYDQQIAQAARKFQESHLPSIECIEVCLGEADFATGAPMPVDFAR